MSDMYTIADRHYKNLLVEITESGDKCHTRNNDALSHIFLPYIAFIETPIITLRQTAWKKALREMEWFLSGNARCPDELLDWWNGQLNKNNMYIHGYGEQLRYFGFACFDQIDWLIRELKDHPNSRRLITTTWNPDHMGQITCTNENPNTPTTCHGTLTQYFVRGGELWIKTYQRSADMLLGVPHNWIQYWAYLLWLAHRTNYGVGGLIWGFGDAHIYIEDSHMEVAKAIIDTNIVSNKTFELIYSPTSEEFLASDFSFNEKLPEAKIKIRPKLL